MYTQGGKANILFVAFKVVPDLAPTPALPKPKITFTE